MMETDLFWMSAVIFTPLVFVLILCFIPKGKEELMRWVTLWGTAVTLVFSIIVFIGFYHMADRSDKGMRPSHSEDSQLIPRADLAQKRFINGEPRDSDDWLARYPWIPRFGIDYFVGLDGISMALVLLTTSLTFLAMIASWNIEKHVRGYCMLFLLLETGMIGTFLALDFFLFYIFWEVMLLPMYFLIGVWGGPRREYAAIKFFLYTLLGSVFILIGLLGFYFTDIQDFVDPGLAQARAMQILETDPVLRALAKTDRDVAVARAKERVAIHSFDLLALTKAGQVASENIKALGRVAAAEAEVAQATGAEAKTQAEKVLKTAQADVAKLQKTYPHMGSQNFFTNKTFQYAMFVLLFIGFAIKVPVFPFHTWLPDAHVEAPTPISMILAGVLLKLGGYGIIRIAYPICPWAAESLAWWVALFGVINIVYGGFAAMAQTDFKKLVAYSSVSHMGYVILGIAVWSSPERSQFWSWGMTGAMFQMIAHGITSAGMFFLVGVIYDRAHHRNLDNFRGLNEPMPLYGGISAIIFFAAMGLPGMCGFVGEFMVVLSTWNFSPGGPVFSILSALTVVLTAAYILWTMQRVYFGTNPAYKDYPDITLRELFCAVPLLVFSILLGVLPNLLLYWMEPSVTYLVDKLARLQ